MVAAVSRWGHLRPMLAVSGGLPGSDAGFVFEPKLDGMRALVEVGGGRVVVRSRAGRDVSGEFPELAGLAGALGGRELVLDGELVAPDVSGAPSFQRLQARMGVSRPGRRMEDVPVVFVAFDVLVWEGREVMGLPCEVRRGLLESLSLRGAAWRVAPRSEEGEALFAMPQWEGVVAKRRGSVYEPGVRSSAWVKVKRVRRQEFVVGGWTPGRGARAGTFGALLLGVYGEEGLVFAGSVGTGFTDAMLSSVAARLRGLERGSSPFVSHLARADARFVEPAVVVEVEFNEWTESGVLRQPSFKGLRVGKDPHEVVRES